MTRWAAVDGGQSGLRMRWLPDGRTGTGPGYVHVSDGVEAVIRSVRLAAHAAGEGTAHAAARERVAVACLGLSGITLDAGTSPVLAAGVARVLGAEEVRLCGDMVTSHAGALPEGYGVVLAAGTGVVCLAVDADGSWHRVDGWGYLFGDAGGAFAIGRAGLVAALRARDGRGPATALAGALDEDLTRLYTSPTLTKDVARLAIRVLACAAEGDPVASAIVEDAAADLADTIGAAVAFLRGTGEVPVACTGGVFAAGEQVFGPLRTRLAAGVPRARLGPAAGSALDGAARLATGPPGPYAGLISVHRFRP
ncbi:BadF/BadG/BcrA/BcrD ATPase family protein [Sphaerisporangium flaviroseum]|uniref:BadF/BadG/BcrA/BcrD ATPase family protein n=1 Tax=Sphaerisporangium flaviroseum TaxID=509199 RepID=A0ABP7HPK5_9ACTN